MCANMTGKTGKTPSDGGRESRRADALRENLRKRKAQQKAKSKKEKDKEK